MSWERLAAAVPAAADAAARWTAARRAKEADRCADVVASEAGVLRASPEAAAKAEVSAAEVLRAIVTGLGILALRPGGVGFLGMHWHSGGRCAACPGQGTLPLFDLPAPPAAGVVYTPRTLADQVVAGALGVVTQPRSADPSDDIRTLRIVDPFCGSGAFLVSAARYLGDALAAAWDDRCRDEVAGLCAVYGTSDPKAAARALVIGHCVHGVDLDPVSVELAGLALQLLAPECGTDHLLEVDEDDYATHLIAKGSSADATRHARLIRPAGQPTARVRGLRAGDALVGRVRGPLRAWPPIAAPVHWADAFPEVFQFGGGFEAVIGNPPFLGGLKIPGDLGPDYREHLVAALAAGRRTTVNLAVYCWLRMHQLASRDGVIGIVGPDGLRQGRDAALWGRLLEDGGWRLYRCEPDLHWPTRSAAVRVCMIWTSRWGGASPPPELRNLPELPPPAHLWRLDRTVSTPDGELRAYEPVALGPTRITKRKSSQRRRRASPALFWRKAKRRGAVPAARHPCSWPPADPNRHRRGVELRRIDQPGSARLTLGTAHGRWPARFASFGVGNYRRFWLGQAGSLIGTWMQITALSWLVLRSTGSVGAVGWTVALQRAPVLMLGPYAAVLVDRVNKRRLVIVLQKAMLLQALGLALLTAAGDVRMWEVYLLAALLGGCDAFEAPATAVLVREIVGDCNLANAQSLNSATANAASLIGPAIAGVVIAGAGEAWCFAVNAASFLGLVVALLSLDRGGLGESPDVGRAPRQLREGLRYAASTPAIAVPVAMTAVVSVFGFQLAVALPALAGELHGGSRAYGLMWAAISTGSILGGVCVARRDNNGLRRLTAAAAAAAALMVVASLAPTLGAELLSLALLGVATIAFFVIATTTVQLAAPPQMRARIASLYPMALAVGAIGSPATGWIITQTSARTALAIGAAAFLLAAVIGALSARSTRPRSAPGASGPGSS